MAGGRRQEAGRSFLVYCYDVMKEQASLTHFDLSLGGDCRAMPCYCREKQGKCRDGDDVRVLRFDWLS